VSAPTQIGCDWAPPGPGQQEKVLPTRASHTALQGHWLHGVAGRYGAQLPFAQTSLNPHTDPQPPQFSGSVLKFVQEIRLFVLQPSFGQSPCVHWRLCGGTCCVMQVLHVPASHIWPVEHALPHAPQLPALAWVSTHWPLQSVRPGRHAHWPPSQTWRSPHCLPQAPQFLGSFVRSRHRPLHRSSPAAHWQTPPWHAELKRGSQALPQPPQLSKFVLGSMQPAPPHEICPAVGQRHCPPAQVVPAAHLSPQRPQLFGSFERFTQAPLQSTVFGPHVQIPEVQTRPPVQFPSARHATQVFLVVSQYGVAPPQVELSTQATHRFVAVLQTVRPGTVEQFAFAVHSRHTPFTQ
jgi:hypothetical protein